MRALYRALGTAAGISILAACTGGQSGIEPPAKVDTGVQSTRVLQFRVGTATYRGVTYFNTLATFRQPNGFSGTLYNTPTITGPAGFTVTATGPIAVVPASNTDAGTNHLSGTPPTQPGTTAVVTTFNQTGGAFAYGIAPANSGTSGAPTYPNNTGVSNSFNSSCAFCSFVGPFSVLFNVYSQPLFLPSSRRLPFLLGPPAVPDFHDGTFPSGFLGYDSGFLAFGVAPVAGTYNLHVVVPSATIGVNTAVFDASATLTSIVGLGPTAAPVVTLPVNGAGATTGQVNVVVPPGPPGVTNQLLYLVDVNGCQPSATQTCFGTANTPTFYTAVIPAAGGTFTLSPTAGPKLPNGSGGPPVQSGDALFAYTVGSDYDILASAVPNNLGQTPALPAQADVTISNLNGNPVP